MPNTASLLYMYSPLHHIDFSIHNKVAKEDSCRLSCMDDVLFPLRFVSIPYCCCRITSGPFKPVVRSSGQHNRYLSPPFLFTLPSSLLPLVSTPTLLAKLPWLEYHSAALALANYCCKPGSQDLQLLTLVPAHLRTLVPVLQESASPSYPRTSQHCTH